MHENSAAMINKSLGLSFALTPVSIDARVRLRKVKRLHLQQLWVHHRCVAIVRLDGTLRRLSLAEMSFEFSPLRLGVG